MKKEAEPVSTSVVGQEEKRKIAVSAMIPQIGLSI
jgi:hypothetical protein